MQDIARLSPSELRLRCRSGDFTGPTSGFAAGFVQANMVILPDVEAKDFAKYCARNPKPCPVLEVLNPGDPEPRASAYGADVRTDLPRYRVFRDGVPVAEPTAIDDIWEDDLVTFLLGCSFTAEEMLLEAGLPLYHIEETGFVPMFTTNIATESAGKFSGPMVVTMRPFTPADAIKAAEITSYYPMGHGAPVHQGDPGAIGIDDLAAPDYGMPVKIPEDHIPVYWACGVTPQEAILNARPKLAITHAPGHMFVSDITAASTRMQIH
ncbi:MAG: putative hydro-lyase [Pseudomonadota bacterium]|nr:putative hydro-lyase [Pseudomonadota bacterium]